MNKPQIQEQEYEKPYHWMLSEKHRRHDNLRSKLILEVLGDMNDLKVLDYGCGDGKFSSLLVHKGCHVTGVDISKRALRFARELVPSAKFIRVVGNRTQLSNEIFDVVFFLDVLEHLCDEDLNCCLVEIHRVLKLGGRLIITVPSVLFPIISKHYRHYTVDSLQNILNEYFCNFSFKGYGYKPPLISYILLQRILDRQLLRRLFMTWTIRECSPKRSIAILCQCSKKEK